jgi:hypothetical protein
LELANLQTKWLIDIEKANPDEQDSAPVLMSLIFWTAMKRKDLSKKQNLSGHEEKSPVGESAKDDSDIDESGPDRNEGNTQPQADPENVGMDYFEEGEGSPEREKENGQKPPSPSKRKKIA